MIQNGTGAFSGIWVIGDGVMVGDQIEVAGTVTVVYGLRQIQSAVPTVQSSGNALPAAESAGQRRHERRTVGKRAREHCR